MNVFLIGYRCTGKTSVGRLIAQSLGWCFIDADKFLVEETGKTVSQIVEQGGWSLFRRLEKDVIRRISVGSRQVIATGGGVVLDADNVDCMKKNGVVFWLRANTGTIYQRMLKDKQTAVLRPSLTDSGLKDEIRETLKERIPLYRNAMTAEVDTENKEIQAVCREVLSILESKEMKTHQ